MTITYVYPFLTGYSVRNIAEVYLMAILVLTCVIFPTVLVSADGAGGALISTESITISGDGGVGQGDIQVNFSLKEMQGDEINSTYAVVLSDFDGTVLSNQSQTVNLLADTEFNLSHTFQNVQPGIYFLKISILAGAAPIGFQSNLFEENSNFTVQRLNPHSISVPPTAQWNIQILNGSLLVSGNETQMEGDSLDISFPVSNVGDLNWTGNWRYLHLEPDTTLTEVNGQITVNKTSTTPIDFSLLSLIEGTHILNFSLIDANDADPSDDYRIYQFEVGPPPLANITVILISDHAENATIGSSVEWNLSIENSGAISYSGTIYCYDKSPTNTVYENSVTLDVGEQMFVDLIIQASPGTVSCEVLGSQRLSDESSNYSEYMYDFDAAEFALAGQSGISVNGGPWFAGDTIQVSLLVLNQGDIEGSASLRMESGSSIGDGVPVSVESGSSSELTTSITIQSPGTNIISWSVISQDGYVSENLSGEFEIYVSLSQWLNTSLNQIDLDSNGMDVYWAVELSEGQSRQIRILVGYTDSDDEEITLLDYEVFVEPGRRNFASTFDVIDGAKLMWINLQPISWTALGTMTVTENVPSLSAIQNLDFSSKTNPARPSAGQGAELEYTISNTGQLSTTPSTLFLTDTNGMILWSEDISALGPGSSDTGKISIASWPEGSVVDLDLIWRVDGTEVTEEGTFISESVSSSPESFGEMLPWGSLLLGVIISVLVIFGSRIAHTWVNSQKDSESKQFSRKWSRATKSEEEELSESKKEVSCTSCSQKLRVPSDYEGQVRCPACKHLFDVVSDEDEQQLEDIPTPVTTDEEIDDVVEEIEEIKPKEPKEYTSSSSTDIVRCPDCESKLRVPLEKRPVKARCPACKVEFRALKD